MSFSTPKEALKIVLMYVLLGCFYNFSLVHDILKTSTW